MTPQPNRKPLNHLLITLALSASVLAYEHFVPEAMIPIKGDVPTIGIGTTVYPSGVKVKLGDTITRAKAEEYLQHDLDKFKLGMMKCVSGDLTKYEFNAHMSLIYNIGVAAYCNSSIPYKINTGDYYGACKTILSFNKMRDRSKPKVQNPKTKKWDYPLVVVKGLDNRRKKEYATCIGTNNT